VDRRKDTGPPPSSTFASNSSDAGGALVISGGIIVNTTIANNVGRGIGDALVAGSGLALYNTIVSSRTIDLFHLACVGQVTSLGNNLFMDPRCALVLLPDDLTGDARLGNFTDNGTPGEGFLPLLPDSPALNAGADAACLPTDQLGRQRRGPSCDIGAIEGVGPASPR